MLCCYKLLYVILGFGDSAADGTRDGAAEQLPRAGVDTVDIDDSEGLQAADVPGCGLQRSVRWTPASLHGVPHERIRSSSSSQTGVMMRLQRALGVRIHIHLARRILLSPSEILLAL